MNVPFVIQKISRDVVETILMNPSEPHRHDHEELIIVTHGKVHSFIPDEDTLGWVIRYSSDFIPQSGFNFYSSFLDTINYKPAADFCSTTIHDLCEIMLRENEREPIDYTMIRHLLGAVLSKLEYNYRRPAGVDFYADKLNMSSRNLNLISQTVFGKDLHTQ